MDRIKEVSFNPSSAVLDPEMSTPLWRELQHRRGFNDEHAAPPSATTLSHSASLAQGLVSRCPVP